MLVDKDGYANVEDQYDPSTFAESEGSRDRVDWKATKEYGERQDKPW